MKTTRHILAALVAATVLLGAAATAGADTLPITQFQGSYAGFNPFGYNARLPDPHCTQTQTIYGSEPAVSGKYPVLIYLHSTFADLSGNDEGQVITQLAAAQGFVAIAPTYNSSLTLSESGAEGHAQCMFGQAASTNVISYACSLPEADCSGGVAVSGFSQGGAIALLAANYDPRVTAAWVMGVNSPTYTVGLAPPAGTRVLPNDKLRDDLGELDVTKGGVDPPDLSSLNALTGDSCGTSFDCLQSDGSGYYVVSNAEVADGIADHCYWMSVHKHFYSCTLDPTIAGLDPGFAPPSTTPWSLISSLNWLRAEL
jgi:hypothetical protein